MNIHPIKKEIDRSDFPSDFIFGAATAAYQVEGAVNEGGRGQSNWDIVCHRTPWKVNERQNADIACNSYYLYKEDVKLAKHMGLDSYRFSISWTRVLPGGRLDAGVNREGIEYYNNLIDELLKNGIQPFVTLFHFEVPQTLEEEYGGFLSDQIVKDYCEFAELCFWEFGDRVKHWITFNEPNSFVIHGYAHGDWAPCRSSDPGVEPYTAARNILLAHAQVVEIYRKKFKAQGAKLGMAIATMWLKALTPSASDKEAAERALDFSMGWFLNPITGGEYPTNMTKLVPPERLQPFSTDEINKLRGSYDFVGVNYYTGQYATDAPPTHGPPSYVTDWRTKTQYVAADGKTTIGEKTALDWLYIYPEGFYEILCHIKKNYHNPPMYITENGVAEVNDSNLKVSEALADDFRIRYIRSHLGELHRAIKDCVNVKGYFVWSLIDNFEWATGYKARFGLVYVDFKNDKRSRYPKDSALWYMNFLHKKNKPINHAMDIPSSATPASEKNKSNDEEIVIRQEHTTRSKRFRAD